MTDPTATASPPRWTVEPAGFDDQAPTAIPMVGGAEDEDRTMCDGSEGDDPIPAGADAPSWEDVPDPDLEVVGGTLGDALAAWPTGGGYPMMGIVTAPTPPEADQGAE